MARHTFYDLCHELKDGTVSKPFATYTTKRRAMRVARIVAKTPIFDTWNVLVIDQHEYIAVGVFPVPPMPAGA
jgi:hypothetical protein